MDVRQSLLIPGVAEFIITVNGASGGDVPVDDNVYIPDPDGVTNLVTVSGNTGSLYKDGYDFAGWSSLANGTGALLSAGDEFLIMDSDVTLYAQWAVATHSVTYDANGADFRSRSFIRL